MRLGAIFEEPADREVVHADRLYLLLRQVARGLLRDVDKVLDKFVIFLLTLLDFLSVGILQDAPTYVPGLAVGLLLLGSLINLKHSQQSNVCY